MKRLEALFLYSVLARVYRIIQRQRYRKAIDEPAFALSLRQLTFLRRVHHIA